MIRYMLLVCAVMVAIGCEQTQTTTQTNTQSIQFDIDIDYVLVACEGLDEHERCSSTDWDGVCIDGWCHCYADAHCYVDGKNNACMGGMCVSVD